MGGGRRGSDDVCMPAVAPSVASSVPASVAVRVQPGEDVAELERRLEACRLILRHLSTEPLVAAA